MLAIRSGRPVMQFSSSSVNPTGRYRPSRATQFLGVETERLS